MDIFLALVIFGVGFCIGGLAIYKKHDKKPAGTLVVDRSDPDDGPYLFVELSGTSVNDISAQKSVKFTVENRNYLSH